MNKSIPYFLAAFVSGIAILTLTGPQDAQAQTATKLKCNGCVGKKQLGKKAVTKKAIKDKAVTSDKLAGNAKPTGGDSIVVNPGPTLTGSAADIANVSITAPGFGFIIATATGNISFGGTTNTVTCGFIDTGVSSIISVSGNSADDTAQSLLNQTTMFPASPGANSVLWRCAPANSQAVSILNAEVVAFFVPNQY